MADDKKGAVPAAPAAGGEEGKKKGNMILVIGIIAGVVVIQAAIAYLIIPKPVDEEAKALKAAEDSLRLVSEAATKMGAVTEDTPIEFVVNISGTEDRFLKATVVFEYDEKNEALGAELRKRAPTKYKDMLIKHMSSLSFTEITDPSERDKICKDLQRMINASLPAKMGEVRSVMFTTYITQ
jgi:flagellar basal body-associated protein FliL